MVALAPSLASCCSSSAAVCRAQPDQSPHHHLRTQHRLICASSPRAPQSGTVAQHHHCSLRVATASQRQQRENKGLWPWCTMQTPWTASHLPFFQAEPRLLGFFLLPVPAAHDTGSQAPPSQRELWALQHCAPAVLTQLNTSLPAQMLCSACSSNNGSLRRVLIALALSPALF